MDAVMIQQLLAGIAIGGAGWFAKRHLASLRVLSDSVVAMQARDESETEMREAMRHAIDETAKLAHEAIRVAQENAIAQAADAGAVTSAMNAMEQRLNSQHDRQGKLSERVRAIKSDLDSGSWPGGKVSQG